MNIAILYCSRHHGNTKRLLDAIAARHEVRLIDTTQEDLLPDLTDCDAVGFASGIYFSKFHKSVAKAAESVLKPGMKTFFLYTCGAEKPAYCEDLRAIADRRGAEVLGTYGCLGLDTYGPFKLIGGIAKGHPDAGEIDGAVQFFDNILNQLYQ